MEDKNLFEIFEQGETSSGYSATQLVERSKIKEVEEKGKITLREGENIKRQWSILRENILYFGKYQAEFPVTLESALGKIAISLVNEQNLKEMIKRIKSESHRKKIAYIHIDSIQILLRSTYLRGIDSPVELLVIDERIKDIKEKVIGGIEGNLKYTTLKFNVNLQYAIPLESRYLDNSIGILYRFKRDNLMEKDDIPFSITYAVSYALGIKDSFMYK